MNRFKFWLIILVIAVGFLPTIVRAEPAQTEATNFRAKVLEVLQVVEKTREDGSVFKQQDLRLEAQEGPWQGQEIIYSGISDLEVLNANFYQAGDQVYVEGNVLEDGQDTFYVVDFVRSKYLYLLFVIFALAVLAVGRFKGLKALVSLFLSFVVIIKFILPQILQGRDPFLVSLLGGLAILGVIIYLTEGFGRKSHLALLSVLASLSATLALSLVFTKLTKLSGLAQEERLS